MAGEPQQKRRRLPFKPPGRTSSAGPSAMPPTVAKDNGKAKAKEITAESSSKATPASNLKTRPATSNPTSSKRPRDDAFNALPATPSDFASDSDSETQGSERQRPFSEEPDYMLAEITHRTPQENIAMGTPQIHPKLLTALFHHFFKHDKTRISKDADALMAKYMDLFVREAIARGKLERDLVNESKGRTGPADNFIEVEDLETLAPWLVMDF
ncbi:hypothetical protein N7466_001343 [Penicillium verhagenii]|uniref:uncharacterized protein n=1 Tax=Penicillium verhagenii TaxID=1562060 RepID=UPI002544E2BC|nr:uncharacterized protein N7466_001343 [Penicillium verhagenii]KAJ5948328.1 hypothetical protein N7466_001343 [Penicillium verhagenii]